MKAPVERGPNRNCAPKQHPRSSHFLAMRYNMGITTPHPDNIGLSAERAQEGKERLMSTWTQSTTANAQSLIEDDSDVAIAVMGATGSGKTTFINLASGSNLRIGRGLISCTNVVQVAEAFELGGRTVTLIDTPGFDDTTKSDADILRMIGLFLATTYQQGKKLAGVIYIHRISDFRMGGISTRNFKMFRELCGESTLKNVVILTNMWGEVSREVGEAREEELATQDMFFKPVLQKGAQLLRHGNTRESAHLVLRHIIENRPLSLQIQRELVDQKKDISQTAAGAELNKELMLQIQKHQKEMKQLQKDMEEAIRTKDEETKRELEIETKKLQAEMSRVQADAQNLVSEYSKEKAKMEERMNQFVEQSRIDAENAAREHEQQLAAVRTQLEQSSSASAAERAKLESKLVALQNMPRRRRGGLFGAVGSFIDGLFGL
ncbi:unnamed protein product [Cyclocybe aegerita]|uniref:G domain-containing protein n=1 Tax=Cyclocybe aegerita TaxID=1973307 RepID=A0A8S0WX23_CYCAE|nr:unnamed protein product [Cyclocybe aegerita]